MAALVDEVADRTTMGARIAPHVFVYALVALVVGALWPSITALVRVWSTMADYNHGFLIAAVTFIWLFKARAAINASEMRPVAWALPALAFAVFAWMVAYRANSELMQQLMLPVIAALAIFAALGPEVLRRVAPPLAFVYFAIPIWEHTIPVLQWLTTKVAETSLGLIGVPTEVEGHHVTIPAGRFSIIEGCSGKKYFVIGLAFASLSGAMQSLGRRRFLTLLAIAVAAALITNWLRVVIVIYAGHVSDMQHYLVAVEHKTLGYALFAPMLAVIVLASRWLSGEPASSERSAPACGRISLRVWTASALLAAAPVLVWALPVPAERESVRLQPLPLMTGEWQGPLPASGAWRPEFVLPDDEKRASYQSGGRVVEIYLNAYGRQNPGRELVYHRNSITPAEHWTLVRKIPRTASTPPMVVVSDAAGERWVSGRKYVVGGRSTSEAALAQLYYGLHAVWTPTPSGTVAMATRCEPDCQAAEQRLEAFWSNSAEALLGLIPDTFE